MTWTEALKNAKPCCVPMRCRLNSGLFNVDRPFMDTLSMALIYKKDDVFEYCPWCGETVRLIEEVKKGEIT